MKQDNNVRIIGITGGVGSGKSAVMNILARDYHAQIILADLVAHELMEPGRNSYKEIVREFGPDILVRDGESEDSSETTVDLKGGSTPIDRKKLGELVFSDPERLARLNEISHKEVRQEILRRIRKLIADFKDSSNQDRKLLIAVEAALLIGSGLEPHLDSLWYISVRDEERIRRLQQSRGYTEAYARSILNRQLSDAEFRKHCQKTIDNNGDLEETKRQLDQAIMELFSQKAYQDQ